MAFIKTKDPSTRNIEGRRIVTHIDNSWGRDQLSCVDAELAKALKGASWQNDPGELYFIAFLWRDGKVPVADLWRFIKNPSDKTSGPLADVKIVRDGMVVNTIGAASGNTLLVLGMEEVRRRKARSVEAFLGTKLKLPPAMIDI
jgi:hypothetical protein